jgi:hypothetical protein
MTVWCKALSSGLTQSAFAADQSPGIAWASRHGIVTTAMMSPLEEPSVAVSR